MVKYSPKLNTFFLTGVNDKNQAGRNVVPEDAISCSYSEFELYGLSVPPLGKMRGYTGVICWVEDESYMDSAISNEHLWIQNELSVVRTEIEKLQDQDSGSFGTLAVWRNYRKQLRSWPESPEFPNVQARPVSPK